MLAKVATGLNQVSISKSLSTMYLMIRVRNWLLTWVGYRSEFFIYWPKDYFNASWLGVNIGSDFGLVAKSTIALLNSSPPAQNGHHFADNIFKHIFMNEEVFFILIQISQATSHYLYQCWPSSRMHISSWQKRRVTKNWILPHPNPLKHIN